MRVVIKVSICSNLVPVIFCSYFFAMSHRLKKKTAVIATILLKMWQMCHTLYKDVALTVDFFIFLCDIQNRSERVQGLDHIRTITIAKPVSTAAIFLS
jgi:hypothetical protein